MCITLRMKLEIHLDYTYITSIFTIRITRTTTPHNYKCNYILELQNRLTHRIYICNFGLHVRLTVIIQA